jgi:two-component system sensor histidine kinase KdpD
MTSQRDSPRRLIASPAEIDRTAQQLARVRDHFLVHGELAPLSLRPVIFESWQRCDRLSVNPGQCAAPLAVSRDSQLQDLREANLPLLRASMPVVRHLTEALADSGYVVVLSDARGCLLDVTGDAAIRRRLAKIDFLPGGAWSEADAGTNAIGTAIATGHGVQLMAAEHYCDGWQNLTCTAAPIRHPISDEVVAVLDVTGDYRLIRPFLTSFLSAAALEIRHNLRSLITPERDSTCRTRFHAIGALLAIPDSPAARAANLPHSSPIQLSPAQDARPQRLSPDEQRARDAERLVTATGIISASLDLTVTMEKVAEQTAHVLGLECAAVCLFDSAGALNPVIWSQRDPAYGERRHALDILIQQTQGIACIRERGELLVIDDLAGSTVLPPQALAPLRFQSAALLPLTSARGIIGFVAAPRHIPGRWETEDIRLALALAAQAATALENARLFAALSQHNRYVEALNTIAQFLNSLLDPAERLDLVIERIAEILDLDAGLVLLRDQGEQFLVAAQHGLPTLAMLSKDGQIARDLHHLAALVAGDSQPLLRCAISDLAANTTPLAALGICDLVVVPLTVGGSALGAMLIGSQCHRDLSSEELTLFTTIAQQLALALHNTQLLREAGELEALREADRLKSQFLATVSHDLRSPLTAIRASVEGLLDGNDAYSRQEQEHLLRNIASQAGRLGRLVDQLLELSQIQAGVLTLDREWIELPALIADVCTRFEKLNPGCLISRKIATRLPLQYIDPDSMTQVLWNLLENACKYAPLGLPILVAARRMGGEVHMIVADRGPGIPAGEREHIFQHFYRLRRDQQLRTQGSGLGLAICRGIVEAQGGRIWAEDRPGGGAQFCIALPLPTAEQDALGIGDTLVIDAVAGGR